MKDDMATFDLPSPKPFKVRLSGKTHSGNVFQRLSREEVKPSEAIIRTKITSSLLTIKRNVKSSFQAAIDFSGSGSKTFSIKASVVPPSVGISVAQSSITVTNARPGYLNVHLTAPSYTPVGTVVKVHVSAVSGDIKVHLMAHVMVQ